MVFAATPCTRRCGWSSRCCRWASSTSSRRRRSSGSVQIIVYTGAIMILFLFVLMLVGRDSSDSVVEMLRGQRVAATVLGIGFAGAGRRRHRPGHPGPAGDRPGCGGDGRRQRQHPGDRRAAVHQLPVRLRAHQRAADHRGASARWCWRTSSASPAAGRRQKELSRARFLTDRPQTLPGPGVFARANSVAAPGAAARRLDRAGVSFATGIEPQERRRDAAGRTGARAQLGIAATRRARHASTRRRRATPARRATDDPHLLPGALRAAVHASAPSACWCGATRSSCSCASS